MREARSRFLWVGAGLMLLGVAPQVWAAARAIAPEAAPDARAVLVELFTSEGCSSCPPADALLRQVNGKQSATGQLIVGLSEHVTYWNNLGWTDPFSADVFTERQNEYGRRFRLNSVYTPQMVVNGTQQFVGNDGRGLEQAIAAEDRAMPVELKVLSMVAAGKSTVVTFTVAGEVPAAGVEVIAVVADDARTSKVDLGENAGRTLTHVAVARSLTRAGKAKAAGTLTVSVPGGREGAGVGRHLVLFAQEAGQGRVVGVWSGRWSLN
jgi:hypothetical protein